MAIVQGRKVYLNILVDINGLKNRILKGNDNHAQNSYLKENQT